MSRSVSKILFAFAVVGLVAWGSLDWSRADEHASHHGGGMGEMGGGMEGEHGRRGISFYPSLMNLPSLTPDQRAQLDQIAQERMNDGAALMSRGADLLSNPND